MSGRGGPEPGRGPAPAGERLQKVIATSGIASRRGAEALIEAGRVTVDGRVAMIGERVDARSSAIAVDGRRIPVAGVLVHLACHKPAGVTSTARDRHAGRTVVELVPTELRPSGTRLYPVGRLDLDSEGLLLLTNDGPWADRVVHPRYGLEREYAVGLARPLDGRQLAALEEGIALEEGLAVMLGLRRASATETARLGRVVDPPLAPGLAWYRVTLGQGWKRQVRRMFGAVGAPVARLVRVRIGPLRLGELGAGEVRPLTDAEVRALGRGERGGGHGG